MQYRVSAKQHTSKMCFVCGVENQFGLHTNFYELENDELVAIFTPCEEHQGYPGRLHGGIAATILDETIGRAIMKTNENVWGVTVEITTRYRKPVPLDGEIRVRGRIVKETNRSFEGTGEILLADGTVAVEGRGKYIKLPIDKIADFDYDEQAWKVILSEDDPEAFEL